MAPTNRSNPGVGSGAPKYPGTFLLALREAAAGMNWQISRWKGPLLECLDAEGRSHMIGLDNLYRRARQTSRENWPILIADFLKIVATADTGEAMPTDLAAIADQLLVRLGTPNLRSEKDPIWSQALGETGLTINLVIDYPNRMCYVTDQMVAESGKPGEEWLARARANLLARTPADSLPVVHEETGIRLCGVEDAYDSSRALLLDELLPEGREHGYFVAVPGRDMLVVMEVSRDALNHVHLMKGFAEKHHQGAPYPLSGELFWVRGDTWYPFPIEVQGEAITVHPPEEFATILKELVPEEEDEEGEPPA
jgi:hypothetical protein